MQVSAYPTGRFSSEEITREGTTSGTNRSSPTLQTRSFNAACAGSSKGSIHTRSLSLFGFLAGKMYHSWEYSLGAVVMKC